MKGKTLDLTKLPKGPFAKRATLFLFDIEERAEGSLKHFDSHPDKEKIGAACDFMDHVLSDCIKGQIKEMKRNALFPVQESIAQFDFSIKHALIGSYKAAIDGLRSALEMATLAVYHATDKHILDEVDWFEKPPEELAEAFSEDAKWFRSEAITPFYSTMLKAFLLHERFSDFNNASQWFDSLQNLYRQLSDHTHIRGYKMSTYALNRNNFHAESVAAVNINLKTFDLFLKYLVETVEQIVVLVSLYNPIILVELPLLEKFGMNEPIGFIYDGKSAMVNKVIPGQYGDYFKRLLQTDKEVLGITEWVNSLPDLTEEDWTHQSDQLNQTLAKFNNRNDGPGNI